MAYFHPSVFFYSLLMYSSYLDVSMPFLVLPVLCIPYK